MSPRNKSLKLLVKPKPDLVILVRISNQRKSSKVELYDAIYFGYRPEPRQKATRYRIKVNCKWFDNKFYTRWEFRDILFRSLPLT